MQNNWEPRVGQKVVALVHNSNGLYEKDRTYVVETVSYCCHAAGWRIGLEGIVEPLIVIHCGGCKKSISNKCSFMAKNFAPIPEQYADMTSEIAQQFKEHPDTVDQPVKVLEVQN